jgi:DNA (cytosine-5)-methyltransferase 1
VSEVAADGVAGMNFLSLFAGIGGFDLAFENSGMVCDSMVEKDKNCQVILKRHFPHAKLFNDVKEVGNATHRRGSIDVICGGFPCQDLSIAGKRAGLAGERSGLWFEFKRIVDELEPEWVVAENVPGLLSSGKGSDFAIILQWLAERGYGVVWRILDAQYFGVAQRRRRVFIVGHLGDGRSAEVLFEREGMSGNTPKGRKAGEEIAGTVTDRVGGSGSGWARWNETDGLTAYSINTVDDGRKDRPNGGMYVKEVDTSLTPSSKGQTIVMSTGQTNAEIVNDGSPSLTAAHEQPIVATMRSNGDAHSGFTDADGLVATSWTLRGGKEGGGKGYLGSEELGMTLRGQPQFLWEMQHASEAYRESGGIAPTLQQRMGTGGNNVPLVGIRRLTPTECERLQGFPDGWTDGQADSVRYRQLGNAVAVPVVEWIGKRIMS